MRSTGGLEQADVIVLGLGGIGSAAAYWLARRGARVIGLEQFELGHTRGESQDHSRIIRLSYHDPPTSVWPRPPTARGTPCPRRPGNRS
jgi:glycine/D-amino acid oxidase-like deaminating enzyme